MYLAKIENIEVGSPTGVIRGCWKTGMLDEAETEAALRMTKDRNLTVHTYHEPLAIDVFGRLPQHAALLTSWLERLSERTGG